MIDGIDPKVDYAFKHLFGREASRPILIDVLNSVLQPAPGAEIRELDILNPFNPKETLDDKLSILDIKARDQAGRQFNIEMQMVPYPAYDRRILYYAARLHQQQLQEGDDYSEVRPTISISFLNHILFPALPHYHLHFALLERTHHVAFNDDLAVHILELPKFTKGADELTGSLDIWLYFLRYADKMKLETLPVALTRPLVKRAFEDLQMLTQAEIERERYEARWKAQLDENSLRAAVAQAEQKGLQQGLEQGQRIGEIHFCQRLLGQPETPTEQLSARSLEELSQLALELLAQAMNRKPANGKTDA